MRPIVEKLVTALQKVYADKQLRVELDLDAQAEFAGDAGDLTEMLGNLLDNACKWCRQRVRVSARHQRLAETARPTLELTIDDDGPGIPEPQRHAVLQRGARADQSTPGHGLGLAMVKGTVALYQGELQLETSGWGGLRVVLRFA